MTNLTTLGNHLNKLGKYYWFVTPFLFVCNIAFANDSLVIMQSSKYVTIDKLGQVYMVNTDDKLIKYTAEGQQQFFYFDRTLGEISYIDATNPFQVLVFFEDFQTIVWLDRTLNSISKMNLSQFGFFQVNTMCMTSDNQVWLYDNTTFQIKKINTQGEVLLETQELNTLTEQLHPNFILEKNSRIYLNNPKTGILVFDNFGQYIETIPIKDLTNFQILDSQIWYQKGNTYCHYHLKTLEQKVVDLPFQIDTNQRVFKQKNNWFWVKQKAVVIIKKSN